MPHKRSLDGVPEAEERRPLSGPALLPHLQPVQIVGCCLGFGGRGDDGPLVVLQHLEPAFQIGGGVVARIVGHSKISAEERSGELGYQLLDGVAFTAESAA